MNSCFYLQFRFHLILFPTFFDLHMFLVNRLLGQQCSPKGQSTKFYNSFCNSQSNNCTVSSTEEIQTQPTDSRIVRLSRLCYSRQHIHCCPFLYPSVHALASRKHSLSLECYPQLCLVVSFRLRYVKLQDFIVLTLSFLVKVVQNVKNQEEGHSGKHQDYI